jgi:hypothetical protein
MCNLTAASSAHVPDAVHEVWCPEQSRRAGKLPVIAERHEMQRRPVLAPLHPALTSIRQRVQPHRGVRWVDRAGLRFDRTEAP